MLDCFLYRILSCYCVYLFYTYHVCFIQNPFYTVKFQLYSAITIAYTIAFTMTITIAITMTITLAISIAITMTITIAFPMTITLAIILAFTIAIIMLSL